MTAALKYEWQRIKTIRSTWWLTVITIGFGTGIAFMTAFGLSGAFNFRPQPSAAEAELFGSFVVGHFSGEGAPYFPPYIIAMVGVFAWGHEYRHGMIRATLTALPSRTNAWAAKYLVVGAWVAVTTLVTLLLSALMGWVWLRDNGVSFATFDVARTMVKALAYTVTFAWVATAFTAIIRQQAAALVLMFLWPLAIENILTAILTALPGLEDLAAVTKFFPFNAGARMLNARDVTGSFFGDPLSPWAGFLVFGAFAAVLMAASYVFFQKRDA